MGWSSFGEDLLQRAQCEGLGNEAGDAKSPPSSDGTPLGAARPRRTAGRRGEEDPESDQANLASFKNARAMSRHCIVPCDAIYEPDWRTGKHIPTRFTAANDETLGVAGIWQPWRAPTGEWISPCSPSTPTSTT